MPVWLTPIVRATTSIYPTTAPLNTPYKTAPEQIQLEVTSDPGRYRQVQREEPACRTQGVAHARNQRRLLPVSRSLGH